MKPKVFFITLMSLLSLVVLGTILVFILARNSLHTKAREIGIAKADVQLAEETISDREHLEVTLQELGEGRNILATFIPDTKNQAQAIDEVVGIIEATNVNANPITFVATNGPPSANTQIEASTLTPKAFALPISITGSGNYFSIYDLIRRFEGSTRHVNVNELTINSSGDTLNYSMTIEVSLLRPAPAAAAENGGSEQ